MARLNSYYLFLYKSFWSFCKVQNSEAEKANAINVSIVLIMRRLNCSAPIPPLPPGQPLDQRKYACDKKGRNTRKKGDFCDYIGRGK